jgi:hypothetical protein
MILRRCVHIDLESRLQTNNLIDFSNH